GLYPNVTHERFGNLTRLREALSIRQHDLLPKEHHPTLQLRADKWKAYSKLLDSSNVSDEEKKAVINTMTTRALGGDLRSFATLINLGYHKNEVVRDYAVAVFPHLYAKAPELAAALCTQAMARVDPVLENIILQERGLDIH